MPFSRRFVLLPLLAAGLLVGCQAEERPTTIPERTGPMVREDAPDHGAEPQANIVMVNLTDFGIEMPDRLPDGLTIFRVTNAGAHEHTFVVQGPGVNERLLENLYSGHTVGMQVTLQPGTYTVYCPIADHPDRGMRKEITVVRSDERHDGEPPR